MNRGDASLDDIVTLIHCRFEGASDGSDLVTEEEIRRAEYDLGVAFPRSYRKFLRQAGAGRLRGVVLFGLLSDGGWGNVVTLNQIAKEGVPDYLLWIAGENGNACDYYLDTSRQNADGECPVVIVGPEQEPVAVANDFLEFLRLICQEDGQEGFRDV